MLCRLFFQIYIKIKTDITDIDIAERHQRTDNQKLKLILLILISLKNIKEQIIKIKTEITEIDIAASSKNGF